MDLSTQDRFMKSLESDKQRQLVEDVETLAREPDRRFFHWEIEFPEVFFGFGDTYQRQLKHKDEITEGSAGFDAVVGNPPYVRMELIKPLKPFLRTHYRCHAERADLFIYFYERAVTLLRRRGRTAFIASSTWTKTKAGEGLRHFIRSETTVRSFLDFGDLPVFEDATTYPCILVAERTPSAVADEVISAVVRDLTETDLIRVLNANPVHVQQSELEDAGWYFEDRARARMRDKIRASGIPLKQYCGSPFYGIKTGLNEAFVVETQTRGHADSRATHG
jgi:hypothetical protein